MGKKTPFYFEYLKNQFDKKMVSNPQYSLRSFARSLEVDPSLLSKILNRKNIPSLNLAQQIIQKLEPQNKEQQNIFIKSVADELQCYALNKLDPDLTDCS